MGQDGQVVIFAVPVDIIILLIQRMNSLVNRPQLHSLAAQILMTALQFLHVIRASGIRGTEKYQTVRGSLYMLINSIVGYKPAGGFGMQPENYHHIGSLCSFQIILTIKFKTYSRWFSLVSFNILKNLGAKISSGSEEMRMNINYHITVFSFF